MPPTKLQLAPSWRSVLALCTCPMLSSTQCRNAFMIRPQISIRSKLLITMQELLPETSVKNIKRKMTILIKILQFVLSLSILVIIHEFGHFFFAKIFKTRVEKFYLFFDPWFSLFKFKKCETEYGVGWLPLGGYVKISGMIDESMDREQLKQPPQPHEFRSKPAGQRLLIMLGGVLVNLILGFIIYASILFVWGEKFLPNKNLTDGIWAVDSLATEIGFRSGDKVISIDGKVPERLEDIYQEVLFGGTVKVMRNNQVDSFVIPKNFIGKYVKERNILLFYPRIPFIFREVPDTSINFKSGI